MQTIINETKIFPKFQLTKLHYKNLFANSLQSKSKWSAALKLSLSTTVLFITNIIWDTGRLSAITMRRP